MQTDLAANGRYELVDMLTNDHQSSRSRNRPQFGTAMNRILARDADAIIVWKASRFSRNWREAAEDVEPLPDHDKDLRSEKGFDTASTAGRLRLAILFVLANWEHDRGGDITARPAAARREPPRASGRCARRMSSARKRPAGTARSVGHTGQARQNPVRHTFLGEAPVGSVRPLC
jgi:DNA invertase Pin-like site-specific DNA recombinase